MDSGTVIGIISVIVIIFAAIAFGVKIKDDSAKYRRSQEKEKIREMFAKQSDIKRNELKNYFCNIIKNYQLNISEAEVNDFFSYPDPFEAFNKSIPKSAPTVSEFVDNLAAKSIELVRDMCIPADSFTAFLNMTNEFVIEAKSTTSDYDIKNLSETFEHPFPEKLPALKNKIDYELSAMRIISGWAEERNDIAIITKLEKTRQDKGYQTPEEEIIFFVTAILHHIEKCVKIVDDSGDTETRKAMKNCEKLGYKFGLIKEFPVARFDFALFMLFSLYKELCKIKNIEFNKQLAKSFETVLTEHFSQEIELEMINKLLENRFSKYDDIVMDSSEDTNGSLVYQIEQFLTKDIWFDDYFGEEVSIVGMRENVSLQTEISILLEMLQSSMHACYSDLSKLSEKF